MCLQVFDVQLNKKIQAVPVRRRYRSEYFRADTSQEKSLLIARSIRIDHNSGRRNSANAARMASSSATPEYSRNLKPVCSSIVSSRPPVARTTGIVPYRKL